MQIITLSSHIWLYIPQYFNSFFHLAFSTFPFYPSCNLFFHSYTFCIPSSFFLSPIHFSFTFATSFFIHPFSSISLPLSVLTIPFSCFSLSLFRTFYTFIFHFFLLSASFLLYLSLYDFLPLLQILKLSYCPFFFNFFSSLIFFLSSALPPCLTILFKLLATSNLFHFLLQPQFFHFHSHLYIFLSYLFSLSHFRQQLTLKSMETCSLKNKYTAKL